MKPSENRVQWHANIVPNTCEDCFTRNGKIFSYDEPADIGEPELHPNCRCILVMLMAIAAGKASHLGQNGTDRHLFYLGELPEYYISRENAEQLGWKEKKGNLSDVASGKMLFGGIFKKTKKILPRKEGRIWYEADLNYAGGYRNKHRIVFSNDGLIFVTYDHYKTFIEIIGEEYEHE